jgi:hypothetical protein
MRINSHELGSIPAVVTISRLMDHEETKDFQPDTGVVFSGLVAVCKMQSPIRGILQNANAPSDGGFETSDCLEWK